MSITELFTEVPAREYKVNGVMAGIVTSIDDPDKLGRVKVKLLSRTTSNDETGFIRVCTPMSGNEWGMFFFPEVGDEVLVAFGDGDIARPYVIGSLWSKEYAPPIGIKDGKNIIRKIKTKNGHELIFHDEDDKNSIELKTPDNRSVKIDDNEQTTVIIDKDGANIVKIDSKNGIITVAAEKKLVMGAGNSKITLDGQSNGIIIESSQSLTVKSQQIVLDAKSALGLKSSGALDVNASGAVNIKGSVVKLN